LNLPFEGFFEPFLISSTVNCVEAQRLVRKLLPESSEKYKLTAEEIKELENQIDTKRVLEILRQEKIISADGKFEDITFFHPKPTPDCPDGYSDRIGIHEVLEISETIKELIIKRTDSDAIERQARKEGMLTMSEDGFIKAARGLTSIEEVLRVTKE